uniref:NADH dehydrogenase subunit 2 n=1 Tax=Batracomorphus chlorophana TaxID=1962539 RepID=UPI00257D17DB|nr:NADH dehydrogenase subunit 2 [Batracomorphus chlorophana]WHE42573.1 NADH dehydrogenase subunit 2 [Batracomorphus chlorophana]
MFLNSTNIMFLSTLNLSIILSLSSNSMFIIWMMIETSNLSFIPIMMSKKMKNSESVMKYFIIQSISSMIIMFSMIMMLMNMNIKMLILMSLIMKMGGVPFHNWIISMIEGIEYTPMLLMVTIMKMPPMMMFSIMNMKTMEMILLSMMIAPLLMINQNSIKKMMCFSSIFNMSMILFMSFEMKMWMTFIMIYTIMMTTIFKQISTNKIKFINQMMINSNMMNKKELWISMLSLGGMPPMTGFMNKMMVMKTMLNKKEMVMLFFLMISSTMVLYVYMTYMYSCLMFYLSMNKTSMKTIEVKKNYSLMFNLIILPMFLINKLFN